MVLHEYSSENKESRSSILLNGVELFFRLVALLCLLYSFYLLAFREDFWVTLLGSISSVTLWCVGAIILTSEYYFSKYQKMGAINSMVFSILFAASFVWAYEIIYYISFPMTIDLASASVAITQIGNSLRQVAIAAIYLLPLVLLRKKLAFGRTSFAVLSIFSAMWILWILCGFPQYYLADYLTSSIWPKILVVSNPYNTSLILNFGSKAVLGVFFISLLRLPYRDEISAVRNRIAHFH